MQIDDDLTTGRLDTRFSGPTMDPLAKEAEYDPQSAAIGSAYVSAFNDYVRKDLHFGEGRTFKPENMRMSVPLGTEAQAARRRHGAAGSRRT